jgi:hypothetical protein
VSNGLGLTTQALVTPQTKVALDVTYADAHVTQTRMFDGLYVRAEDSLPVSPWNVTASVERDFTLRSKLAASLRVEDAFRSSSGPTYLSNPASVYYTGTPPDPSANVLNVRAAVKWPSFEVAAFFRNTLNSHPLMQGFANGVDNIGSATQVFTLVPRTFSASCTWRY